MNVTLKQLRAFVAIAESGSFAEASEQVHLSQPALSIAIKNFEDCIGGKLLARSTRKVALTPEGQLFIPVAKRMIADWDEAFTDLNNLFSLQRGKLAIAAMPSYASTELPMLLKTFRDNYPQVNIKVHDVIAEDTVAMVRTGKVELGITFDPGLYDDLIFEPLFTDQFIAVIPIDHPLCSHSKISLVSLAKFPFISMQQPSSIRALLDNFLLEQNIKLTAEFETNQFATIGQMVHSGLGVSVMPALYQKQLLSIGVECRPLKAPAISRRVGLITRKRYPLSSAAQALIDIIKGQY